MTPRPPRPRLSTASGPPQRTAAAAKGRVGVWVFGALGGLATTMVVGARAMAKGRTGGQGMVTETEMFDGVPLAPMDKLVFGGHEVRDGDWAQAAEDICLTNGSIPYPLMRELQGDLRRLSKNLRPGSLTNAGASIARMVATTRPRGNGGTKGAATLAATVARLKGDITDFMARNKLRRCICVNLISTEPALRLGRAHRTAEGFAAALAADRTKAVRPSAIYAWVAAELGLPFVHFTPSNAGLIPAVRQRFDASGAPYGGQDGKTGETLVKSALAPMFKYRNLQVLSWQGYNMLGDRDGVILDSAENKASKVQSKDSLLGGILGYPLHTHVGIDYVPSLDDLKTAWDFIHFRGFLDYKMSMQFTWQGCDAILAAPLVLDMVRLADLAARRGEAGPMRHLSCFFKSPVGTDENDLHRQWHTLVDYARSVRETT